MNNTVDQITAYLANGGLFNSEQMPTGQVADLLIDVRTELIEVRKWRDRARLLKDALEQPKYMPRHSGACCVFDKNGLVCNADGTTKLICQCGAQDKLAFAALKAYYE